jgi:CRISPR-associated protein Csb2
MQTLLLQFPARRYHATPWGHHVNEGLIEWPPSPWRLLRALLATGYRAGLWNGDGPPAIARLLIEKLAGVLPSYRLPQAAGARSRHYMPLARLKKGREDTAMVFDTWAQVDGGILAVIWDVELTLEESALLAALAERLGYLGRSESWISARLAQPSETLPDGLDCYPSNTPPTQGWEQVPFMAALTKDAYAQWRRTAVESALFTLPALDSAKKKLTKEEKKILAQREKAEIPYPLDLISCLQAETSWLHRHGWSQPPGSRRVFYWRPANALEAGAPRLHHAKATAPLVEAMLMSMTTASGNDHALPSVVRTLPQAELLHRAIVSFATRNGSAFSTALIGRNEAREPLRGRHEHAHILPVDLDDDGHLDHVLIWAPMGLDGTAQKAVRAVRQTYTKRGTDPLRLALVGSGRLEEFRNLPEMFGQRLRSVLGPPGGTTLWASQTPFVPPRYLKKTGENTLAGQISAELASRGFPKPISVQIIDPREDVRCLGHRHFIRSRRRGPEAPIDCGFSLVLCFAEPVEGPICLGYGSHFGLGLFTAVA